VLPFVVVDETRIAPLQPFGVCCALAFFAWDAALMSMAVRRGFDRADFRVGTFFLGIFGWGFAWGVDALFYRASGQPGPALGWSSTGAILGATVGAFVWSRFVRIYKDPETKRWRIVRRKRPHSMLAVSEVVLATWPLGHAIGRLGCALVHDHVGKAVPPGTLGSLLAVGFPRSPLDGPDHAFGPIHVFTDGSDVRFDLGLLEMLLLAALAIAFARTWKKPLPLGTYTMRFALVYGFFRFLLDFLRTEDGPTGEPRHAGLTFAQYWSLAVVALGVALLIRHVRRRIEAGQPAAAAAAPSTD
jgi:phosphatidylglycerol:prolipoprotein diacylglycerol transferase